MDETLRVSSLSKTWIFDLDGTLVKHNGYKVDGVDTLLPGVREFFDGLSEQDFVIIITARSRAYKNKTEDFLQQNKINYHHIIFDAPYGERILINDRKTSGLATAHAINTNRDEFLTTKFVMDESL